MKRLGGGTSEKKKKEYAGKSISAKVKIGTVPGDSRSGKSEAE